MEIERSNNNKQRGKMVMNSNDNESISDSVDLLDFNEDKK